MAVTLTWRVLPVKDFFNFVPPSILSGSLWLAGNSLFKAESVSIIQLQGGLLSFFHFERDNHRVRVTLGLVWVTFCSSSDLARGANC